MKKHIEEGNPNMSVKARKLLSDFIKAADWTWYGFVQYLNDHVAVADREELVRLLQEQLEEVNDMPVRKCSNGKYRIGSGKCMYETRVAAERAYRAYLAKKHSKGGK